MAPPRKSPAARTRKPAAKKTTRRKPTKTASAKLEAQAANPVSEEERQGMIAAYTSLQSVGASIPKELAQPVELWIAEEQHRREIEAAERAQRQAALDEENAKGPWFVRNCYNAPFNLRLDRQTEKRRIELKPRGAPGDMHPLLDEDLNDPMLKRNLGHGLIEVIPGGEANRVIEQQTHNTGRRVHTPLALLRNPQGDAYPEGAVKLEAEYGQQGVTVAVSDPAQLQGHVSDKEVARSGGLQRVQPGEVVSGFVPTGGNPAIVSSGDPRARQRIIDDVARRKDIHGPAAGLGGLTVTVDPVRQS